MNKETEEKISKLAALEQNSQRLLSQKYNYQNEILEIESALEELNSSSASYKIIGNIMVKTSEDKIKQSLEERKDLVLRKIKNLEVQEKKLFDETKSLQEEVMKELEG
jgi:prefoldin beta subunit